MKTTHISKKQLNQIIGEIKGRFADDYKRVVDCVCQQIREYYQLIPDAIGSGKFQKPKLIVALSGGVDSTLVTYLAVKAVGRENVMAVVMPMDWNQQEVIYLTTLVKKDLQLDKANFLVLPIELVVAREIELVNSLTDKRIMTEDSASADLVRIGNLASRLRVSFLYDIGKSYNGRVLGTGNRTEYVQGFAAKYGTPISYDFGVLDELYKTDIYEMATLLGVPLEIIKATPSTGYYPGQTHALELGASIAEQDVASYLLFEKKVGVGEAKTYYGLSEEYTYSMLKKYQDSKHKRTLKQPHVELGLIK